MNMQDNVNTISAFELKRLFRISDGRTIESYVREGILTPVKNEGAYGAYSEIIFDRQQVCKIIGLKKIPDEPLLTSKEAMDILGYPKEKWANFRGYCRRHKIPHYFFRTSKGGRMYFLRSEIEAAKESEAVWDNEFADFVARNFMLGSIIKHVFNSVMLIKGLKDNEKDVIQRILFERKDLNTVSQQMQLHPERVRQIFAIGCKKLLFQLKIMEGNINSLESLSKEVVQLRSENKVLMSKLNDEILKRNGVTVSESEISVLSKQIESVIPVLGSNISVRVWALVKQLNAETLDDIAKLRRSDVEKYQGVGKKTIDALEMVLISNGFKFKGEDQPDGRSASISKPENSIYETLLQFERRIERLEKKNGNNIIQ